MDRELSPKQKYKKYFVGVLPMILVFILASVIAFSIGLFSIDMLFLTVPFILIPVLFALQVNMADVEGGSQFSNKGLWSSFRRYFVGPFNGCYNVINSFFKAFLFSLLGSVIYAIVFVSIAQYVSPTLGTTIEAVVSMIESGVGFDDVTASLSSSPTFVYMLLSVQIVEGLIFTVLFIHYILGSAPMALIQGIMGTGDRRGVRMIYQATRKSNRGLYNKNYSKFAWPLYPLVIVGFFMGLAISLLVLVRAEFVYLDDPVTVFNGLMFAIPMGVLGSVLLLAFYLPYFFYSVEAFAFELIPVIRDTSVRIAKQNLEELKRMREINDEQARAYEEDIKRAQEIDIESSEDDSEDK